MANFNSKVPLPTGMQAIAATTSDPLRIRCRPSSFAPAKTTTAFSTRDFHSADPILRDRLFGYASYMPEFERTQRID